MRPKCIGTERKNGTHNGGGRILRLTSSGLKWAGWASSFLHFSWRRNKAISALHCGVTHMSTKAEDSASSAWEDMDGWHINTFTASIT